MPLALTRLLCLALTLIAAALPAGAQEKEAPEAPGNDTIGAAGEAALPATLAGKISPKGDRDWWRFSVPGRGELALESLAAPPGVDLAARLLDADHKAVSGWILAPGKGQPLRGIVDLPGPGEYYLELADNYDDAAAAEEYRLRLRFAPAPDAAGEPNDTVSRATAVAPTGQVRCAILPRGDVDWLRLQVPHAGELKLAATGVPPELDVALRVYDDDLAPLTGWLLPARKGADTAGTADLPRAGTYYVRVSDNYDDARSPAEFRVGLEFTPSPDRFEPNDRRADAVEIKPGTELQAAILPRGDVDHYRITVAQAGEWRLQATGVPENLDLALRVWDADRNALSGWLTPARPGADTIGVVDLPGPGTYVLELRDAYDDQRSVKPYTLKQSFVPAADAAEPNNGFRGATPIEATGTRTGAIFPRGDVDFYRARIEAPGEWHLTVSDVPEHVDIALRVLDADGKALGGWITSPRPGADAQGKLKLPKAGTYYVEVRDNYDDARSTKAYTLTARFAGR